MRPYARLVAVLPGRFAPRFPIFDAQGGCYTWAFPSQRVATRLKISPLTRLFSVSIVCPPAPILLEGSRIFITSRQQIHNHLHCNSYSLPGCRYRNANAGSMPGPPETPVRLDGSSGKVASAAAVFSKCC